jgi:hypothetical protein
MTRKDRAVTVWALAGLAMIGAGIWALWGWPAALLAAGVYGVLNAIAIGINDDA